MSPSNVSESLPARWSMVQSKRDGDKGIQWKQISVLLGSLTVLHLFPKNRVCAAFPRLVKKSPKLRKRHGNVLASSHASPKPGLCCVAIVYDYMFLGEEHMRMSEGKTRC